MYLRHALQGGQGLVGPLFALCSWLKECHGEGQSNLADGSHSVSDGARQRPLVALFELWMSSDRAQEKGEGPRLIKEWGGTGMGVSCC